jgi:hypothetical protein
VTILVVVAHVDDGNFFVDLGRRRRRIRRVDDLVVVDRQSTGVVVVALLGLGRRRGGAAGARAGARRNRKGIVVGAAGGRTDTLAELAFYDVNGAGGAVVVMMMMLNVSLVVVVLLVRWVERRGWSTGTAVTLFLTFVTDLFVPTRVSDGSDRRVLTFPSGKVESRPREVDANLGVGVGGSGCLGGLLLLTLAFPVGRGKDAEGNRDASLKVQVGDLGGVPAHVEQKGGGFESERVEGGGLE